MDDRCSLNVFQLPNNFSDIDPDTETWNNGLTLGPFVTGEYF